MLPSTGLFKDFSCPYFNSTEGTCLRPYCHFKHVRKDEAEAQPLKPANVPEYKPAPKLLPLPALPVLTEKKQKLEYQPEKPAINASPSKCNHSAEKIQAPLYIPAPTKSSLYSEKTTKLLDLDDCEEELDELSGIIDDEILDDDFKGVEIKNKDCKEVTEKSEEHLANESTRRQQKIEIISQTIKKERRDSNTSSSSSSRHKHKLSSRVKESNCSRERESSKDREVKKVIDREGHKDKRKERDKERDKHRKRSELKEKKDSKEKNQSSSSRHKTSSSSSSRHRSSTSSSKRKSSPSSTSATVTQHKRSRSSASQPVKEEDKKTGSVALTSSSEPVEKFEFDAETADLFATTQDDIMKECEMIYDQLEQEFADLHKDGVKKEPLASTGAKRKTSEDENESAVSKKRVAYENADKYKRQKPATVHKPNHIQNAMQAIFQRQTELRRKQEEETAAANVALREAEEKVREANEALRKVKEKASLTPLIPKTYLTAPAKTITRTIAPVANILALERAKKKVEELKAEKQPAFTPAQTRKGAVRVAHKATAASNVPNVEPEKKPKPPVLEPCSTKISFNIRMQYYELMVKHCSAMYPNIADAWERAQTEELVVFKKCSTPVIYKSSALLSINKLRKEAADSGNKPPEGNKIVSHEVILAGKLAQNTSWSVQKKMKSEVSVGGDPFDKLPGDKAYEMVSELRLTEEQLVANGFPRAGHRAGTALISNMRPMRRPNETERYCSRCGKVFNLTMYEEVCVDECNYHPKSTGYRRGFADNQHRCCQQPAGTPGCTYANYHVTDYVDANNLTGYVSTIEKDAQYVPTKKDIFALDCEMCYTTEGIELTRVTVVDINARTVYDALVKPDNKIVDYNTVYSGITEQMLANETRSLRDVQAILMSMFHSKTVLVGHSLESDLKALKLIHGFVVDTSVLFPHKMGPPKKRALKTLCIENLKRIIQENESGHDSAEDAEVCIQLVKFYLRNKIS